MTIIDFIGIVTAYIHNITVVAAVLVFLHCFDDPGYTWTKKKSLYYCLSALALTIILNVFPALDAIGTIVFWTLDYFILFRDYPKKKFRAFLKYFILYNIFINFTAFLATLFNLLTAKNPPFGYLTAFYNGTLTYSEAMSLELSLEPTNLYLSLMRILGILYYGAIFCFLYFRLYRRNITMQCRLYEKLTLFICPFLTLILITAIILIGRDSVATTTILGTLSILMSLTIPLSIFGTRISRYYREQTVRQDDYMQAQLAHFTQYKQAQEETALFRHDIRNNLLCVSEMLASGKTEEATSYLQDLLKTSEALRQTYVSGDEMLDCIIGVKSSIMRESHIDFQLDGVLAGGLPWKPVDICAVFANAIDNAIEACQKLPEADRYIRMNIRSTAQYWFISVVNPTAEQVDTKQLFQKKGGYTSKTDKERHGIGTYKMRQTVEAYGGVLKAEAQDQAFILEIMIDKSSS